MTVQRLITFLKNIGEPVGRIQRIVEFYMNNLREEVFTKSYKPKLTEEQQSIYLDQIIGMIQQNPNLDKQIYRDYIKLVFDKWYDTQK